VFLVECSKLGNGKSSFLVASVFLFYGASYALYKVHEGLQIILSSQTTKSSCLSGINMLAIREAVLVPIKAILAL
jgi:hypothetical protein